MTTKTVVADGEGRFAIQEHRELAAGLAYIAETVEGSVDLTSTELWARLHHALGWLERELTPHLAWEDAFVYPQIDTVAGTPWATKTARFEHRQIGTVISVLEADSARWLGRSTRRTDAEMVAHLSAIRALIAAHMEREERFLLPLIEDGTPAPG